MSDVEFEEQRYSIQRPTSYMTQEQNKGRGITELVISWGWAKNKAQANVILLSVAIVCLLIAAFLFFRVATGNKGFIYKEDIPTSALNKYPPGYIDSLPSRNP